MRLISLNVKKGNYSSSKIAAKIAIKQKLSTRKAINICSSIASSGIDIPTPSQCGFWKRKMVEAKKRKKSLSDFILYA